MQARLDRFVQLTEALRAGKPKPEYQTAGFCASALVNEDIPVPEAVARVRENHAALGDALGWTRAPSGAMRWLYASMFASRDVPASHFLGLYARVQEQAKAGRYGSLYHRGSRAALILAMDPSSGDREVARFLELKKALSPPWWRANAAVTETFAAAHVLSGDMTADQITQARDRAISVFAMDRRARSWKRDGARLVVLRGDSPEAVLGRFNAIEDARREDRFLRHRSSRQLSMEWAAAGRNGSDVALISGLTQAMPRRLSASGYARARLAHMIGFGTEGGDPAESATALAAVIAAQAAAMAAIVAASTAATTSAATS